MKKNKKVKIRLQNTQIDQFNFSQDVLVLQQDSYLHKFQQNINKSKSNYKPRQRLKKKLQQQLNLQEKQKNEKTSQQKQTLKEQKQKNIQKIKQQKKKLQKSNIKQKKLKLSKKMPKYVLQKVIKFRKNLQYSYKFITDIINQAQQFVQQYQKSKTQLNPKGTINKNKLLKLLDLADKCKNKNKQKLKCPVCPKQFDHYRQLGGHVSLAHKGYKPPQKKIKKRNYVYKKKKKLQDIKQEKQQDDRDQLVEIQSKSQVNQKQPWTQFLQNHQN